jgi:hypothetical protein
LSSPRRLKENLSMADAALPFSKQHVQIVCVGRSKIRQRKLTISDLQNRTPARPAKFASASPEAFSSEADART